MPLEAVAARLERERAGQRDLYARLSETSLEVGEPLAPLVDRYRLRVRAGACDAELRLTDTALAQLCAIAGVPMQLLERAPAAVGLATMRGMLALSRESDDRQHLLRLREEGSPRLRAVLPPSYVRLDDREVLAEVIRATRGENARAAGVWITDDMLALRVLVGNDLDLGAPGGHDPGRAGFDVVSSETGCHPLELRHVLYRVVCANGMTRLVDAQRELRARYTRMDRPTLGAALHDALGRLAGAGERAATRLAGLRGELVGEPAREVEAILQRYRLGSPRSRLATQIGDEVGRAASLFGLSRFELVQTFTAVARGLDYANRVRVEDAMGSYLEDGLAA